MHAGGHAFSVRKGGERERERAGKVKNTIFTKYANHLLPPIFKPQRSIAITMAKYTTHSSYKLYTNIPPLTHSSPPPQVRELEAEVAALKKQQGASEKGAVTSTSTPTPTLTAAEGAEKADITTTTTTTHIDTTSPEVQTDTPEEGVPAPSPSAAPPSPACEEAGSEVVDVCPDGTPIACGTETNTTPAKDEKKEWEALAEW